MALKSSYVLCLCIALALGLYKYESFDGTYVRIHCSVDDGTSSASPCEALYYNDGVFPNYINISTASNPYNADFVASISLASRPIGYGNVYGPSNVTYAALVQFSAPNLERVRCSGGMLDKPVQTAFQRSPIKFVFYPCVAEFDERNALTFNVTYVCGAGSCAQDAI